MISNKIRDSNLTLNLSIILRMMLNSLYENSFTIYDIHNKKPLKIMSGFLFVYNS